MKKSLIILFIFLLSISVFADSSDYIVGLNAYKDGFYDIAKISLEDFIRTSKDKSKISYSKYLLYQIYLSENDLKRAEKLFSEVEKIKDKRFNPSIIRRDKVRFLIKNSKCEDAAKIIKKYPEKDTAIIYANSNCSFDSTLYKSYLNKNIPEDVKVIALFRSTKYPKAVKALFNKLSLKSLTDKQKNYLGKYFYKYKNFDYFWKIYNNYKDDDLVNLALNRVWNLKKYKSFIKSFEINSRYKISPANNCRAITIYRKQGKIFKCDLIQSCYTDKNSADYHKSMLACLINKKKSEDIKNFIYGISKDNFKYICEYSEYLIANNYYDLQALHKFNSCKQVYKLAEILLDKNKPNAVIKLFSGKSSDKAYFYISKAYLLKGDKTKAKLFKDKIVDKKLQKELVI